MKRWKEVKLGEIILPPMSGEWGSDGEKIKVLRTTNFTNEGRLDLENVVSRNIDQKKVEKKKLNFGDTIIEKSGGSPSQPVGRVVFFDIENDVYLCNNFTSIIRLKEVLNDSKYLFWFLFNQHLTRKTLAYQNKTTGIINLQLSRYVDELQIPLPPLPTQKQIAARLDAADALRQKDRQLLDRYDTLTQSLFMELFGDPVRNEKGWEIATIRDLVREVKYGTSKPAEEDGDYKYLRMNNITYEGFWDFSSLKYINLNQNEISKYTLTKDDLVFNRTNSKELVGKTAVYKFDEPVVIAGYLIRVRTNERAIPEFIWGYLNSQHGKMLLRNMCKSIVGMANINAQELQNIEIPVPPLALQNHFAELVTQIEAQKALVQTQAARSEALFQRLLQEAFG